ncbi:MarR family transcriptional regulator [Streptomyces sp. NPDC015139]|uniref:MarR family transcriptional regulator n=1 Tax=Streptomyces sp. NPDC015139 TaxID=3364942 RepID=UPI0036F9F0E1
MIDREPTETPPRQGCPGILRTLGLLHGDLRVRHGLSLGDYLVLGALAEARGGPVPIARLTAFVRESGDRMSYLLKGLQAAGLIERSRRARDRRTVEVTLTDAGHTKFTEAESTAQALLRQNLGIGPVAVPGPGGVSRAAADGGRPGGGG